MKTFELAGQVRTDLGKQAVKAIRQADNIPAIIYGGAQETVADHFIVSNADVRKLIYSPEVFMVELNIDGKKHKSILQDIQFHPVTDNILHLDFLRVYDDRPMTVELPVVLEGLAPGVRAGGRMALDMRKLKVKGLLANMPEKLTIDVSKLELGQTIQVGELNFDGLELLNGAKAVVCRVQLTRAARGAAAAEKAAKK